MEQFLKDKGITAEMQKLNYRPGRSWGTDMFHWNVTIKRGKKSVTVLYSMGSAHCKKLDSGRVIPNKPKLEDVLYSLHSEAQSALNDQFEFIREYEYESYEEGLRVWLECRLIRQQLTNLMKGCWSEFEKIMEEQE